jgi:tetratricopeptide (TPR) repeat protein
MIRGRFVAPVLTFCLLAMLPAHGEPLNALATAAAAALKAGDTSNADSLATQALAIGALGAEDRARVLLNRGLARERLGRRAEALIDFTAALDLHALPPEDQARALFDRGVTLDEMGRTADAIGDYSAALKLDSDFAAALNNRANAYRRAGKLNDAKRDYLASLDANNTQPEYPSYGLGQIAETQGDMAAARDWYKKSLTANPNYGLASKRLAAIGDVFTPVQLKPPSAALASNDAPIVLRPPTDRLSDKPVERPRPAKPEPRKFEPLVPTVAPAAYAPPSDTPELRPAIVESIAGSQTADMEAPPPRATRVAHVPPGSGHGQVQLGAWREEGDAADGWNHIVGRAGNLLDGLTPEIVAADVPGKGRYYRLRAATLGQSATDLCNKLQGRGLACMPVK